MAEIPQDRRTGYGRDGENFLPRWFVLVLVLLLPVLLTTVFGMLSGVVRDMHHARGLQSADNETETPHLAKRDPLRALAAAGRRDGNGTQPQAADGTLAPQSLQVALPIYFPLGETAGTTNVFSPARRPGSLPRAPPVTA